MGNWAIHIEGVGCHGNDGADYDAETIAQHAVLHLVEQGHDITHAVVTHGAAVELKVEKLLGGHGVARSDGHASLGRTPLSAVERARDFYAVYCQSSGGKNFRGDPCPTWDDLPEAIRGHWTAVAVAAAR